MEPLALSAVHLSAIGVPHGSKLTGRAQRYSGIFMIRIIYFEMQ
jgi:hypothetical protein